MGKKKLKKKVKAYKSLLENLRLRMADFMQELDDAFQSTTEGNLEKQIKKKLKPIKDPSPKSED